MLAYDTVRSAAEPQATLLAFYQSAYEAGARNAGWGCSTIDRPRN